MDVFRPDETAHMARAIELARNGEGRVAPNPPVGCVLVRDGAVVGEGWHDRYGGPHAEAMALENAGGRAKGTVAYVTLSPCASRGRQPPCAGALAHAEVAEVVAAVRDPNPKNASGIERLRELGVPVRVGLLAEEAEFLARGFFKRIRRGLPHVILKYAMTLDGKTAAASGDSRWVSGPKSREAVQDMRSRADAIMVGVGTALIDDPLLNVRGEALERRGGAERHPQPRRVILDSRMRLPPEA
ncbi:MAG: bifunctional diaminohydroxyphosphoribosylaminopyrimidine deaminase/5-amino-6-(5-phosphoribosylamino)uracil reductase RibD, partial [Planctomycetota bacterium]|nr:bifunctional diaminohydroxyphosphoribosylaminopyrimidine deaminase/5-amino-6-(5-phosphoribosylamino)uracil reductase RibD [Planctomycetota bacterium]